jgi:beta-lactamase regulating signal transducer with metallopeptidase domain
MNILVDAEYLLELKAERNRLAETILELQEENNRLAVNCDSLLKANRRFTGALPMHG